MTFDPASSFCVHAARLCYTLFFQYFREHPSCGPSADTPTMSAQIEAWLHRTWSHRGLVPILLSPLSLVFRGVSEWKRRRSVARRLPVPVVVVGNIYVGGTGKTPVTIALVRALREKSWTPGVISRGYGRSSDDVRLVTPDANALLTGDEPLLIAEETKAPVAVSRNRYRAALHLLEAHPEVDLIISDDGLQHHALARDVELAVVGARGIGNGWVLPAGPLREPPSRLDTVDAIVLNTTNETIISSRTPRFAASSCFDVCRNLATGERASIDELAKRLEDSKGRALAAAGIASPGRFFAMIRAHGIEPEELALPDHYDFAKNPFAGRDASLILITGKDAVKCATKPEIAGDDRIWVVGLELKLDDYLIELIDERCRTKAKMAQNDRQAGAAAPVAPKDTQS